MKINVSVKQWLWNDRNAVPLATIGMNPLNFNQLLGKIMEVNYSQPPAYATAVYGQLLSAGLPNTHTANQNGNLQGIAVIGPMGFVPFKVVTGQMAIGSGSLVDIGSGQETVEYADTSNISACYETVDYTAQMSGAVDPSKLVISNTSSSSVGANNQFQLAPATEVIKLRGANRLYRLMATANFMRVYNTPITQAGASINGGGFTWDSVAAAAELPVVAAPNPSTTGLGHYQFQIEIDDNIVNSVASQTGRLYVVITPLNKAQAFPSTTKSAVMTPSMAYNGNYPWLASAIDYYGANSLGGTVDMTDFSTGAPMASLDNSTTLEVSSTPLPLPFGT